MHAVPLDALAERETRALEAQVLAALPESTQPVLVTSSPGFAAGAVETAMLVRLVRAGVDAGYAEDRNWIVGDGHVVREGEARTLLVIVADAQVPLYRA